MPWQNILSQLFIAFVKSSRIAEQGHEHHITVIFSPCEKPCQVRLWEEHMLTVCLNQCLCSFSLCPLSFGNDYTLSAEQIYYRWSSLVPSRDPGKLPPYALFPYAAAALEFCLCTLSNFSLCENKRSKSNYGLGERPKWAKTADGTRKAGEERCED